MKKFILILCFALTANCASFQKGTPGQSAVDQAAHVYLIEGDSRRAIQNLESLMETEPQNTSALFLLADIFDATGHPHRALPLYLDALKIGHQTGSGSDVLVATAMAVVAIRDRAQNFHETFQSLLDSMQFKPGNLPGEAWFQLMNLHLGLSRLRGDDNGALEAAKKAGCITKWQMAGPIGPYIWNDFSSASPPGGSFARWPTSFDGGPDRGISQIRDVDTDTCFVALYNPTLPPGGKSWARTTIVLAEKETVRFRFQNLGGARVFIGGRESLVIDPRTAPAPQVSWFEARLPAGPTDIAVMVATESSAPGFSLSATNQNGARAWTKADPSIKPSIRRSGMLKPGFLKPGFLKPGFLKPEHKEMAASETNTVLVQQYAQIKRALWWDDAPKALGLIEQITNNDDETSPALAGTSAALLMARAEALLVDQTLPYELAFEQSRSLEEKALAKEPALWQARIHFADRKIDDGLFLQAIEILKEGTTISPFEPKLLSRLTNHFLERGWLREASLTIGELEKIVPLACDTWRYKLTLAREKSLFYDSRVLAQSLAKCDSYSPALAEEHARAGMFEQAIEERKTHAKRDPKNAEKASDLFRALLAKGDEENAIATLKSAIELAPRNAELCLSLADLLASLGKTDQAIKALEAAAKINPENYPSILKAKSTLEDRPIFAELRVDGIEAVKKYREQEQRYDSSSVFVLDRAVYLVGPRGQLTTIVHTITHLRTDEAIEEHGEFELPEMAHLLTARTIKPDGRLLEPEDIDRKATFSLPDLEPGDIIETEHIEFQSHNQMFPGGFDTSRFYFQNFSTVFHHSEMIVIVPDSMEVVIDKRGNPPPTMREHNRGFNIFKWKAHGVLPHLDEPFAPSATEFLPSIRVVAEGTWSHLLGRLKDLLADKNPPSRTVANALSLATREISSDNHRARRAAIYNWVQDNIRPENDIFEQSSYIIARRTGHSTRALLALLQEAGYEANLALVKPQGADELADTVPSLNAWGEFLVYVPDDGFISLADVHAPYGYLPADLRNRPARLVKNGKQLKTGLGTRPVDTQKVILDLTLFPDGRGSGTVTETLEGVLASQFRAEFEDHQGADRDQRFEQQFLSKEIPGARLKKLTVLNESANHLPLELIYEIEIPDFLKPDGEFRRAKIPYAITLAKQSGGLAKRKTPLILSSRIAKQVSVKIRSATKTQKTRFLGQPEKISSAFGDGESWFEKSKTEVKLGYRATLNVDRVVPERYGDFLRFARNLDRLTNLEIQVE